MGSSVPSRFFRFVALSLTLFAVTGGTSVVAQTELQQLREEFVSPPAEARPWTWFHVMSGNMTREGITKDLEAISDAGIGGIVLFHVTQGISHGPVKFNSPEHLELIEHVAAECERLGLQFMFHNADGWSSSGGPWITPEQSMKRVVWSDALAAGGRIDLTMPQPATREDFYREIAVLAYPSLPGELRDARLRPMITASDPAFDPRVVTDGDPDTSATLHVDSERPGWIQFSYDNPVEISSLLLENSPTRYLNASLEFSQDGQTWAAIATYTKKRIGKFEWMLDEAFAPIEGTHFRLTSNDTFEFGEIDLSTLPRIPNVVGHTSMAQGTGSQLPQSLDMSSEALIDPQGVIDLTAMMDDNGRLTATLPQGSWTIMRFGYTSTGATNVIASPEGTGLEVDKLSPAGFKAHYDGFVGPIIKRARAVAPNALTGVMIDSYEVGGQNWTDGYEKLFADRFGQSVVPWLPAYAGRLVSSAAETRDMLEGIRIFNAELMRTNYYGTFAQMMKQDDLQSIAQPYGMAPHNDVDAGATVNIPTGEFWMGRPNVQLNDAVSAAHLYGRRVVAAEAFTSQDEVNWRFDPDMGKKWGDRAWIFGINQFMFHRFAHQANTHVMPGMTMNRYGSHFDRTQPWWEKGGAAWFTYMARGQHLLRQGLPVIDIAMFVGEDSPVACGEKPNYSDRVPAGAELDCLNAETLLSRSNFVDGALKVDGGMQYKMIWWPSRREPSKAALARMEEARTAGVPVVFAHRGENLREAFVESGLEPRVVGNGPLPMFTERRTGQTQIFFLLNFEEEDRDYDLRFAAGRHAPQMWDPVSGTTKSLPAVIDPDDRTRIALRLLAGQSTFLVFDPSFSLKEPAASLEEKSTSRSIAITEPWSLSFDPVYGNVGTVMSAELFDFSTSDNPEIRHFSGKVTYRTTFDWHGANSAVTIDLGNVESVATVRLNGAELGTVWTRPYSIEAGDAIRRGKNELEVEVANLWVNRLIGDAALENTSGYEPEGRWPEREMVEWYSANEPLPQGPRRTFSTQDFFEADDPLVPSGLLGPVRIIEED